MWEKKKIKEEEEEEQEEEQTRGSETRSKGMKRKKHKEEHKEEQEEEQQEMQVAVSAASAIEDTNRHITPSAEETRKEIEVYVPKKSGNTELDTVVDLIYQEERSREPSTEWELSEVHEDDRLRPDTERRAVSVAYEALVNFKRTMVDPCIARCEEWILKHMKKAGFQIVSVLTFGSH